MNVFPKSAEFIIIAILVDDMGFASNSIKLLM